MYKKVLLTGLALTLAAPSFADVTLDFSDHVDLLLVNGEKPNIEGGFFSSDKKVTLPDGENQIVFRYIPTFKNGKDREQYTSNVVISKFTATDAELQFEFPKYRNVKDAERFDKSPDWKLIDSNKTSINFVQDTLVHHGMQIGRDFEAEAVRYNATQGIAAVSTGVVLAAPEQASTTAPAVKNADASTAEEMLHFWYSKADPKTQQRFKDYINKQK
ncbi:DUF2057 family protein [Vibrio gallicus]|uniref:DUF2057 family protein n=1 Tax=Vibrio gallicus TaxID=190897 RepID=UPI0021C4A956|nr:DUF2057 family protein [Vibrio gallicus]